MIDWADLFSRVRQCNWANDKSYTQNLPRLRHKLHNFLRKWHQFGEIPLSGTKVLGGTPRQAARPIDRQHALCMVTEL